LNDSGRRKDVKLRIPVRGLERALSLAVRAAAHGNPGTPVLSAALFEAEGSSLRISATDGELGSSLRCSTQVEEEGRLAAGARVLHELVRSLKDGELTLEQKNGVAILSHGGNRYSLRAYDAKGFPEVSEFPRDGGSFTVPAEGFARDVGRVLPSVSKDATRPILTGVLLSVGKGAVRMVATDSYRMAVTTSELEGASEDEKRAIVPARCLAEAVRIAALCEQLTVTITENAAYFKGAGITLKGRLAQGTPYRGRLPRPHEAASGLVRQRVLGRDEDAVGDPEARQPLRRAAEPARAGEAGLLDRRGVVGGRHPHRLERVRRGRSRHRKNRG
jgi:DNA polymerase-3 subunit beta